MESKNEGLRIVEFRAENVKRLTAVDITPSGDLVVIGGRNAQGKSSVLDAIWLALGGGSAARETVLPIRDGEERASVMLDLGEIVVHRQWTRKGTSLSVKSAAGATFSSPQRLIDDMVGRLSFDPLAFTRLSAREQRDALLSLVDLGIDLDSLQQQRDTAEGLRLECGRRVRALGNPPAIDPELPTVEASLSDITRQIAKARDEAAAAEQTRRNIQYQEEKHDSIQSEIERLTLELAKVDSRLEELAVEWRNGPSLFCDVQPLINSLDAAEELNQRIRENENGKRLAAEIEAGEIEWEGFTDTIRHLDKTKDAALTAAQFPVEGMSFDDTGVLYQGLPFSQASSAEQIRVSLAMAMATSPKLRVLRIKDGSLLDEEAMAAIRNQVTDGGFQLWIERVGSSDEGAVIIEDGATAR